MSEKDKGEGFVVNHILLILCIDLCREDSALYAVLFG